MGHATASRTFAHTSNLPDGGGFEVCAKITTTLIAVILTARVGDRHAIAKIAANGI